MDRQNRQNRIQAPQRQIHIPSRGNQTRVASRYEMQQAAGQSRVVVEQTASQAQQLVVPIAQKPTNPFQKVANNPGPNRVTLEQIAIERSTPAPQPIVNMQPAMMGAGNVTSQTTLVRPANIPMPTKMPNNSKLANHAKTIKSKVTGHKIVQKSLTNLKSTTEKVKNSPQMTKIKAKLPKDANMRPADVMRYGVVALCLIVAGFLAYDTWKTNQQIQSVFTPAAAAVETPAVVTDTGSGVAADMPRSIVIPSIGVNANVAQIGLTVDNHVGLPGNDHDVGWYEGSAKPGANGVAFMTGHYNLGGGAVFNSLVNLPIGEVIYIEMGDGTTLGYTVYNNETVPLESVSMPSLLNANGGADEALNIMTCAGYFNGYQFSQRTIVYAKRTS